MFFDKFLERRVVVTIANRSTNDHTVVVFPLWFFNAVHIGDIRLDPQFFQFRSQVGGNLARLSVPC